MILVFAESQNGGFKKAAFESLTYGVKMAAEQGVDCVALALGTAEGAADLGKYGVSKVYSVANEALNQFDSQVFAKVIAAAAEKLGANTVVLSNSSIGKGRAESSAESGQRSWNDHQRRRRARDTICSQNQQYRARR